MKKEKGEFDFEVTTNDASKTVFLDGDGNEVAPEPPKKEPIKNGKGGVANVDPA